MNEKKTFYITTTLPYVNSDPHIGFALEIVQADVLARYWREKIGDENVFFNTGVDEHGQKIFEAAEKAGRDVQEYVDHYAGTFEQLKGALGLSYDAFMRTTDPAHIKAAQEMWKRCKDKGDIYEKEFEGLYCIGCERYLTERDMVDGRCVIHGTAPELRKEKNWFFRLSKYQNQILNYLEDQNAIIPNWRREEAISFVKDGLEDFSISREKSKLGWGIPVPDDETQVMYVWFDALTNYISTLGWPEETGNFKKFWEEGYVLQLAGKDQIRFQSIMWQGMLFSAGIKNTDQVFYHGFINSGGQKMSKSLGNVISPYDLVEKYGIDATRFLLLRHVHPTDDTDVTWDRLGEWYTADLANGLGNLVSRIMKMTSVSYREWVDDENFYKVPPALAYKEFDIKKVLDDIWFDIAALDTYIQNEQPFKKIKIDEKEAKKDMAFLLSHLLRIAVKLEPIMPETSKVIQNLVKENKMPEAPLFLRKD